MAITAEEIIDYWYSPEVSQMWFSATPQLDAEIKRKYATLWQAALSGELDHWQATPEGCLALVILLDQFPLNMFRGQRQAFSSEAKAIEVARVAVDAGFDKLLSAMQCAFLYMPFMHSEKLADQTLSVALFTNAGLKESQRFAEHHRDLIQRFGRFPHRNVLFGRTSSVEELAYLSSDEAFTG